MDMKMPIMDGYEATKTLSARSHKKPIVAVTAHASSEDKVKSLDAGCDFYLSKPVELAAILAVLKQIKSNETQKA